MFLKKTTQIQPTSEYNLFTGLRLIDRGSYGLVFNAMKQLIGDEGGLKVSTPFGSRFGAFL